MEEEMSQIYRTFFKSLGTKKIDIAMTKLDELFATREVSQSSAFKFFKFILNDLDDISFDERVRAVKKFITYFLAHELTALVPPSERQNIIETIIEMLNISKTCPQTGKENRMFG